MGKGANSLGTEVTRERHRVQQGLDHHIFRLPELGSGIRALCELGFIVVNKERRGAMLAGERASVSASFSASFLEFSVLYLNYAKAITRALKNNTLMVHTWC
jgi:hypothetical protein